MGRQGPEAQVVEVDEIQVGAFAHLEAAPIVHPVELGVVVRLLVDDVFDRQPGAPGAVAHPVHQLVGRRHGIEDQVDVGAGIRETRNGMGIREHRVDHVVVARDIIGPHQDRV